MRLGEGTGEAQQPTAQRNGKRLRARREHHAPSTPNEERVVEERTETSERVTHRGLTDARTLGGPRDTSLTDQGIESNQQVQIDAVEVRRSMNAIHVYMATCHWIHVNARPRVIPTRRHSMEKTKKVLVVGATGGTGRAAISELVRRGHRVTAFSRHAESLEGMPESVTLMNGDATDPDDVERAVAGQDAVVITLGITENPLRVRLFGTARTPLDVRSAGTRNVIAAMRKHGVRRLVVQSSFGVGETRDRLRFIERLYFGLLLKPQIADTELQEHEVRNSGVDWVLAQPVHLTDDEDDALPFASAEGQVRDWKISRNGVARFLALAAQGPDYLGRSVALSGRGAS